ncbi:MAG: sulfurtransferase TusA family protein [Promethearchaeota archaeon]|jgi:tRNA 2-thiouridine synthesizing protein A
MNYINDLKESLTKNLDVKGLVCPMTFVYTKLKLEELDKGDILEVILDFPPAAKNIPENCRRQDLAELIEKKALDSRKHIWQLKLRKI